MSFKASHSSVLAQIMRSQKYRDLTLMCQDQKFLVHKAIVCIQSPVLAAACDGNFQEASTNIINIDRFDARTVKCMIDFFYRGGYDHNSVKTVGADVNGMANGTAANNRREITADMSLYQPELTIEIADNKSDASLSDSSPSLPEKARENVLSGPTSDHENDDAEGSGTAEILLPHIYVNAIADYYMLPELKEQANAKIQRALKVSWTVDGISDAVKSVLELTCDTSLRQIMAAAVADHIGELIGRRDFMALEMPNEFTIDIIQRIITNLKKAEDDLRSVQKAYAQKEGETVRLNEIIGGIDYSLETLSTTDHCRHCLADFHCYIEDDVGREPRYLLRCSRCRTRHY